MEQHPIPQQITSYEFKLVGEMTLKQFAKAAGGIIVAMVINTAPLETWLMAFLKSVYDQKSVIN